MVLNNIELNCDKIMVSIFWCIILHPGRIVLQTVWRGEEIVQIP